MKKPSGRVMLAKALETQKRALAGLNKAIPAIERASELLSKRKGRIVVIGVGKSAFVGMKCAATMVSLGEDAVFLHPVDALHGDMGAVRKGDVVIALSASGESAEVVKLATYLKTHFKPMIVSITAGSSSSLARLSDIVVTIDVKEEGSPLNLAPMASTTATLVACDLIACALVERRGSFKAKDFARLHPGGSLGLKLTKVSDAMSKGKHVPLIDSAATFKAALARMNKGGKGVVGVIEKTKLVGVITDGDIRRFFSGGGEMRGALVRDVMTKNPKTLPASSNLNDALAYMEERKITSLFVTDKRGRVGGFIHMHDIVGRVF